MSSAASKINFRATASLSRVPELSPRGTPLSGLKLVPPPELKSESAPTLAPEHEPSPSHSLELQQALAAVPFGELSWLSLRAIESRMSKEKPYILILSHDLVAEQFMLIDVVSGLAQQSISDFPLLPRDAISCPRVNFQSRSQLYSCKPWDQRKILNLKISIPLWTMEMESTSRVTMKNQ
jgi:hypothetical protein